MFAIGYHLASLPVNIYIGKLILFGAIFRCIDPILTIAACLSNQSFFLSPLDKRDEAQAARMKFSNNSTSNSYVSNKSDHLTMYNAYNQWWMAKAKGGQEERNFCRDNFLSFSTLKVLLLLFTGNAIDECFST